MTAKLLTPLFAYRDRLLGDPQFHQRVLRFLPTRWIARRRARELFNITTGFVQSQVLVACVQLDLFERLASGPKSTAALAADCDIEAAALERILQAAAELRLLRDGGAEGWGLGELGAASRGSPGIGAMVRHHELLYRDLADPVALLRDRSASQLGEFWSYAAQPGHSVEETAAEYSELMARSQSFVADDVLATCPLDRYRHLVDIGGGSGVFAAEALQRFPQLTATVFDLPDVVPLAASRFADLGLSERASVQAGNMFGDDLPRGSDVVSLVRILHDHDDAPVEQLLRSVRAAMAEDGLLLIAEPMARTREAPGVGAYFQLYLWAMRSGRPRSAGELRALLEAAGFADVRELKTFQPLQVRVLVARPGAQPGTP